MLFLLVADVVTPSGSRSQGRQSWRRQARTEAGPGRSSRQQRALRLGCGSHSHALSGTAVGADPLVPSVLCIGRPLLQLGRMAHSKCRRPLTGPAAAASFLW